MTCFSKWAIQSNKGLVEGDKAVTFKGLLDSIDIYQTNKAANNSSNITLDDKTQVDSEQATDRASDGGLVREEPTCTGNSSKLESLLGFVLLGESEMHASEVLSRKMMVGSG